MTAVVDIERAVVRVCFGVEPASEDLRLLGDERVWRIYREMVRKRLWEECRLGLRRTAEAAGAAFDRVFVAHLAEEPPRTRFFREIVPGFARSAESRFRADASLPAYLADLCAWEAALWEVGDLSDRTDAAPVEFAFDRVPVLSPTARLLHLRHAVHETPATGGGYAARDAYLCVHRRADDDRASTWTLAPVTHALLARFERGADTVTAAIQNVAAERGIAVDPGFIDGLCTVLADFLDRGVILGSR